MQENPKKIKWSRLKPKRILETYDYTLGFLAEISFTILSYHHVGCLGYPEKSTSLRNYNLFVWSAVFQPKWSNIEKTYKNHQNAFIHLVQNLH